MNDLVKCTNCETKQVVKQGSEKCLKCGIEGRLQWIDENTPETEERPKILT